ncbi:MAG TPA: ABC transporter permease [Aggregatilineales bacterium]|nr:ABC transporter permease [Aggregatilineales bacterium]
MSINRLQRVLKRHSYLFALLLLVVALLINFSLQANLFALTTINRNLANSLPLMVLVVGQTVVIIGGGIDLSVGAIVTLGNAILATRIAADASPGDIGLAILLTCGAGLLAGVINGLCVAYLRLQPLVTTYATSFIFSGVALLILPRPGGDVTRDLRTLYLSTPGGIPFTLWMVLLIVVIWLLARGTRYAQFLFATGGKPDAAYFTGVPVNFVRFSTYLWSGLFGALAALALTVSTRTGSPHVGDSMTLQSVVAVILGGTRLSGGQGGVVGSLIGVVILGVISNIISFANVPSWWQTLVNALIIIGALVGPGLVRLARKAVAR